MISERNLTAPKLWPSILILSLIVASLTLMVTSLAVQNWAYSGEGDQQIMMSLYKCVNCPEYAGDWSWECFSNWLCDISASLGECKLFDEGFKGSVVYITLEVLAIVSALILVEKVLAYILNRDYGYSASLYALAALMFLLHLLATLLWFGLSEATFHAECGRPNKITEKPVLCATTGPAVAVAGVVVSGLSAVTFVVIFYRREIDKVKIVAETSRLCNMGTKLWMKVVLCLLLVNLTMIAVSVASPFWVKRTSNNSPFTGSLLKCDGCDHEYQYIGWDCFAGFICDIDSDYGECVMYKNLKLAGRVYLALSTTSGMLMLLWLQSATFVVLGREYGFASLNYVYAVGSTFFQALAVILWFSLSDAGFSKDCHSAVEDWKKTPEICSTLGPSLAIATTVSTGITAIIYIAAYCKRGFSLQREARIQYVELSKVDPQISQYSSS
mmetsp:Transcript_15830/g.28971  ORF Transcript_15830/g.28971 Transcript_15830/m.28971 type:complete len:442 (-) Transcript_15830:720-2045(-)